MRLKKRRFHAFCMVIAAVIVSLTATQCAPATSEVEIVERTVIVEGTPEVIREEVEVTKVVEVEVTNTPAPAVEGPVCGEPVYGGEANYAMSTAPPTLDTQSTSTSATSAITAHVFEPLVTFGYDFSIIPMLAESWEISEDALTYTFHLREGVKFHDGTDMTSEDVIASMTRFMEVSPRASQFEILESYEAVDDYTVEMTLSTPSAAWLSTIGSPSSELAIHPKEIIEGKGKGELKFPDDIVGTGPYRLVEYEPDQFAHLQRFEDYQSLPGEPDGIGGAKIAYFDDVYFHFVPETGARMAGLEAGEYDWIGGPSPTDLPRLEAAPETKVEYIFPASGAYLLFNHADELAGDLRFREAVLAALDMEALGLAAFSGNEEMFELNYSIWPQQTDWFFEDDYAAQRYNQNDPEKAAELLEELGYDGREIVLSSPENPQYYQQLLKVSDILRGLGVKTKVELYDWPGIFSRWAEESGWHISMTGNNTVQLLDPNAISVFLHCDATHPVSVHYCNPEMDAAIEALDRAATPEERKELLRPILRIFWEDLGNIKTIEMASVEALRSDICGYQGYGRGGTYRAWGVWRQP